MGTELEQNWVPFIDWRVVKRIGFWKVQKNAQVLNTLIATNCYGFGIEMRWEFCTYDVVRKPKMTFEKTDLLWEMEKR